MAAGQVLVLLTAVILSVNCEHWNVTVPQRIVGIEGSCVTVPCSFEVPHTHTALLSNCSTGAVWRRGNQFGPVIKTKNFSGDLRHKNCTTVFQSFTKEQNDEYFFRLDCPNLQYSFKNGVRITVTPGVATPLLTSVSHVTEGDQVTLHCSAMVPCPSLPPSFIWAAPEGHRQERSQIVQSSDGQMTLKSTLTFLASARHHNQTVTCSVSYPRSAGGSSEASVATHTLNVSYGPRSTAAEASVSGPVSEGRVVFFTCSSDANPPVHTYTWLRNNGSLVQVGRGETLVLQVRQTDSGLYLCEAQSQRGTQRSGLLVLEVNGHRDSVVCPGCSGSAVLWPYVVSGAVAALCIFTVVVVLYKLRSLSMRLKRVEQKGEPLYSDLQNSTIASDYDQLQPRQPKVKSSLKESNYENAAAVREVVQQQTHRT